MAGAALTLLWAGAASAQPVEDPSWPCQQRRVEHLSMGALWPGQVIETEDELPDDLADAAARLALRRLSEDEARAAVAELASLHPGLDEAGYGRIFAHVLGELDRERSRLVAGIARYADGQARLAEGIEALRAEMGALEAAAEPDFDRMDALEAEIDGRERVLTERNRALTYVCESPVLIEQRAFALGRMLWEAAG